MKKNEKLSIERTWLTILIIALISLIKQAPLVAMEYSNAATFGVYLNGFVGEVFKEFDSHSRDTSSSDSSISGKNFEPEYRELLEADDIAKIYECLCDNDLLVDIMFQNGWNHSALWSIIPTVDDTPEMAFCRKEVAKILVQDPRAWDQNFETISILSLLLNKPEVKALFNDNNLMKITYWQSLRNLSMVMNLDDEDSLSYSSLSDSYDSSNDFGHSNGSYTDNSNNSSYSDSNTLFSNEADFIEYLNHGSIKGIYCYLRDNDYSNNKNYSLKLIIEKGLFNNFLKATTPQQDDCEKTLFYRKEITKILWRDPYGFYCIKQLSDGTLLQNPTYQLWLMERGLANNEINVMDTFIKNQNYLDWLITIIQKDELMKPTIPATNSDNSDDSYSSDSRSTNTSPSLHEQNTFEEYLLEKICNHLQNDHFFLRSITQKNLLYPLFIIGFPLSDDTVEIVCYKKTITKILWHDPWGYYKTDHLSMGTLTKQIDYQNWLINRGFEEDDIMLMDNQLNNKVYKEWLIDNNDCDKSDLMFIID